MNRAYQVHVIVMTLEHEHTFKGTALGVSPNLGIELWIMDYGSLGSPWSTVHFQTQFSVSV
uniref:Uncharacterized protein n=1 Tax=Oryza brachyantha TaxID=4533 RepID=J3MM71_ORYBR